jgi:hypothetical protein
MPRRFDADALGSPRLPLALDSVSNGEFVPPPRAASYLGADNVLWGTDCLWYGSPQPYIQAFRAFQIPAALQSQYGYPAITDEIRRKVFGWNGARVYGMIRA